MGMETLVIAGLVMAAASGTYSGITAHNNAQHAAEATERAAKDQAAREMQSAAEAAAQSREQGRQLLAEQTAALAGNGVSLESGSAGALLSSTDRLAEQDALSALRGGQRASIDIISAGQQRAGMIRSQGNQAVVSAGLNTISSMINIGAGYRSAQQAAKTASMLDQATANGTFVKATGQRYSLLSGDT